MFYNMWNFAAWLTIMVLVGSSASLYETRPHRALKGMDGTVILPAIPHHVVQARQQRQLYDTDDNNKKRRRKKRRYLENEEDESLEVGALYQGYGTHYVDLWVGSPPQRQTVIVDTGSSITGFPCTDCKDCGHTYHTDDYFNTEASDTFQKLDCQHCLAGNCQDQVCKISMSYQEGSSWYAYEALDYAYLGGPHDKALDTTNTNTNTNDNTNNSINGEDPDDAEQFRFPLKFGCQWKITGLFKTQLADGIMGMDNKNGAFFKQMKENNGIDKEQFSLCFTEPNTAAREGTMAGAVTLGGVDKRLHYDPMVYAASIRNVGFYTIKLRTIYLRETGGESIVHDGHLIPLDIDENTLNTGGIIVDSGTTETYFNRQIGYEFKKSWKKLTNQDFHEDSWYAFTDDELLKLPTIVFQLNGSENHLGEDFDISQPNSVVGLAGTNLDAHNPTDVLVAMPATRYMEYDPDEQKYTPRIYFTESGGSVLGANFMTGHDIMFDIDNRRIGITESSCDYQKLVNSIGDTKFNLYPGNPLRQAETYNPTTKPGSPKGPSTNTKSSTVPVEKFALIVLSIVALVIGLSIYAKNRKKTIQYAAAAESELPNIDIHYDDDDESIPRIA